MLLVDSLMINVEVEVEVEVEVIILELKRTVNKLMDDTVV